jgi:hypothetical protein
MAAYRENEMAVDRVRAHLQMARNKVADGRRPMP